MTSHSQKIDLGNKNYIQVSSHEDKIRLTISARENNRLVINSADISFEQAEIITDTIQKIKKDKNSNEEAIKDLSSQVKFKEDNSPSSSQDSSPQVNQDSAGYSPPSSQGHAEGSRPLTSGSITQEPHADLADLITFHDA